MCVFVAASAGIAAATNAGLLTLATTAYQQYAERQQAKALQDSQVAYAQKAQELANRDANESYAQLAARELQEREAAAGAFDSVESQARRNASLVATSAGEAGVSGNAVAAISADIRRKSLDQTGRIKRTLSFTEDQLAANRRAVRQQAAGRANAAFSQISPVASPDYFGAALNIGADAFSAYSTVEY